MAQLGQAKLEPGLSFNYDLFEPNKLFLGLELGPQTLTLKLQLFFSLNFFRKASCGASKAAVGDFDYNTNPARWQLCLGLKLTILCIAFP